MTNNLSLKTLKVRFFTEQHIQMKFWIGAVLRNRFLYAAEQVYATETISLRQIIETLPLTENHFLYKQLCEGFPKGYLFECSDLPYDGNGFTLKPNMVYSFSIVLIGNFIIYQELFIEAISKMITSGFGHPVVPLQLIDVTEELSYTLPDLAVNKDQNKTVEIIFKTPVNLIHLPKKTGNGFQNKLNNFPSFYQFMRSLTYRIITLGMLYSDCISFKNRKEMDEWIENYISPAINAVLLQANLCYETRFSTPKIGQSNVYTMKGYTGKLMFGKVCSDYLPVLSMASPLSIGSDINYGLGNFRISLLK